MRDALKGRSFFPRDTFKGHYLQNGKTLKQSLLDMAKADHHRVVLRQAVRSGQIPRGLQPNIEPHIYKADPLVLSEWDQAQKELSIRLANILIKHYSKVIEFEQTLQNNMQAEMQREISRACPPRTVTTLKESGRKRLMRRSPRPRNSQIKRQPNVDCRKRILANEPAVRIATEIHMNSFQKT